MRQTNQFLSVLSGARDTGEPTRRVVSLSKATTRTSPCCASCSATACQPWWPWACPCCCSAGGICRCSSPMLHDDRTCHPGDISMFQKVDVSAGSGRAGASCPAWVRADDTPVPATSLIPDDAVLVVRIAEPKALIERAFDQRVVQFVQSLPPYKEAMARPETQQALTMVNFFQTKYQADLPDAAGKTGGRRDHAGAGPQRCGAADRRCGRCEDGDRNSRLLPHDRPGEASKQGNAGPRRIGRVPGHQGLDVRPGRIARHDRQPIAAGQQTGSAQGGHRSPARSDRARMCAQSSRYQTAIGSVPGKPQLTVFADMAGAEAVARLPARPDSERQSDGPPAVRAVPGGGERSHVGSRRGSIISPDDGDGPCGGGSYVVRTDRLNSFALPSQGR